MLPDFPMHKEHINNLIQERLKTILNSDALMGILPRRRVHEGSRLHTSSVDGYEETTGYFEATSELAVTTDEIIAKGPEVYLELLPKVAEELIATQKREFFRVMDETTEKSGNVIDAEGRPFHPEMLLEALERMSVEFDRNGNPSNLTFIAHPAQMSEGKNKSKEWNDDPVLSDRYERIMKKKKEEWLDRENSRKLVD